MKGEALVMTIDFGKNHFNAIYLNNQLKLISSNGSMITVAGPEHFEAPEETTNMSTHLSEFFKH
jgi:hypothetical protein